MNSRPAALRALDRARAWYEAEGYEVTIDARLPSPFDGLVADAMARRNDETILVEVRAADMSDNTRNRLSRLSEVVRDQAGWRLDIVTFQPEKPLPKADPGDVLRRLQEARRVAKLSLDAAVMLTWSAVEGMLLNLHPRRDTPRRKVPAPRALIRELAIDGVLSDAQAERLDEFAQLSHQIAHGRPSPSPDRDQLEWATRFVLAASQGQVATIENMIDWFRETHGKSCGRTGLSYDSEDGHRMHDGRRSRDIAGILMQQFASALRTDVTQVAEALKEAYDINRQ